MLRALTDLEAPKPGSWDTWSIRRQTTMSVSCWRMWMVNFAGYAQDNRVAAHGYDDFAGSDLIDLWLSL